MRRFFWLVYVIICAWVFNVRSEDVNTGCFKPIKNSLTHLGVFNDVKFINGYFRIVDSNGYILSSRDGKAWLLNDIDEYGLNSISWNGEKYFVTSASHEIYISDDLINWSMIDVSLMGGGNYHIDEVFFHDIHLFLDFSKQNMLLRMEYWGVPYNKRGMFSLDKNETYKDEYFFYGDDIYNLKKGRLMPSSRDMMVFDNKFYLLTRSKGVYVSDNVIDWEYLGGEKQPHGYAQTLIQNDSVFVSVGDFGYISTSSDQGKTWKVQKLNTEADLYDAIWDGKQFIAVGNCGTVAKSKDGYDWSFTSTGQPDFYTSIAYDGKTYIVVGAGPGEEKLPKVIGKLRQRMFISNDAIIWTDYTNSIINLYKKSVN